MRIRLTWKKALFSSTYSIYSNEKIVGALTGKYFAQTASGELNGKKYTFRTKGILKQETEIFDSRENKVVGRILYGNWMSNATLELPDKSVSWAYDNLWNTKWHVVDAEGTKIKYGGTSTSGEIESNTDDALLLLSGLFVTNYFWQMAIGIMIVAFLPIWISVLS
ncbi:hypothetical protein SAMN05444274_103242 [Mariniphaga anaerophila]|uniref:YD repeat-containing protein n=1 Tax=Mariniphaga anaerophila TaxID=1484053 RepID=A0A1M4Y5Q1_9BACT|nr:hypothetical protein [Mariniphaga anaerophila]SHF01134.1 hypothetical protein SAMN05444274_103242 [Mariniphaga anaerophila]